MLASQRSCRFCGASVERPTALRGRTSLCQPALRVRPSPSASQRCRRVITAGQGQSEGAPTVTKKKEKLFDGGGLPPINDNNGGGGGGGDGSGGPFGMAANLSLNALALGMIYWMMVGQNLDHGDGGGGGGWGGGGGGGGGGGDGYGYVDEGGATMAAGHEDSEDDEFKY